MVNAFERERIIRFIIMYMFRGKKNPTKEILDYFKSCLCMNNISFDNNFWDSLELGTLYRFQKGEGPINEVENRLSKVAQICFCVSNSKTMFITSDNPSFLYINKKDMCGKCNGIYFPISPRILVWVCRNSKIDPNKKYMIYDLNDFEVKHINRIIYNNADEVIIANLSNIKELIECL